MVNFCDVGILSEALPKLIPGKRLNLTGIVMKKKIWVSVLTGLVVVGAVKSMVDAPIVMAKSTEEQMANQVYSRVNRAVVLIRSGDRSHGSGFMVSADGLLLMPMWRRMHRQ
jgi:hypothetical protein